MYYILYGFLYCISILPLRVLYIISDAVYVFIYYIIGYRKKVVMDNLTIAFPQKSETEKIKIAKEVYHNFVDTFIEAIKLITTDEAFIRKHVVADYSKIEALYKTGKKCQAHCGHNFNWELVQHIIPISTPYTFLGVYMPIENKAVNKIFYDMRCKTGTVLLAATNMRSEMLPYRNKQYLMGLAADQNPGDPNNAYWLNFFGRPTPFVKGPEKNARANDTVVVFVHFTKIKRGYYELHFEVATQNPNELSEGEITKQYIKYLEEKMTADPGMWLWTHKRWKYKWKPEYSKSWIDTAPMPLAE